jgi:hypothetical protein
LAKYYPTARASSGVMVAHFTPTPNCAMACAASTVTWSSVWSRYSMPRQMTRPGHEDFGRPVVLSILSGALSDDYRSPKVLGYLAPGNPV